MGNPYEDPAIAIEDSLAATGAYDDDVVEAEVISDSAEVEPFDAFADAPITGVVALRKGLAKLDDDRMALAELRDVDSLATGSADLALVIGDLQTLQRSIRRDVAVIMLEDHVDGDGKAKRGNPKHEVPGLGVIDVPGGNEWKDWDSEKLLRDLIKLALIEPDGSLRSFDHPMDVADSVYDTLVMCLPATASLQWRVGSFDKVTEQFTGLKAAGIHPEDYANHTAKERLAKIPGRPQS